MGLKYTKLYFLIISYDLETCSFIPRNDHRLRIFVKELLGRTFRPERDEKLIK
jgi:hypothetical protein